MVKLVKIALIIVVFLGLGIRNNLAMSGEKPLQEKYVRHEIFLGKWGSGNGQFGLEHEVRVNPYGDVFEKTVLPEEIAVDGEGNIYVADVINHRVQKLNPEGKFLMKFEGKDDPNRYFENLWDIAVDLKGNIYISNRGQKKVLQFDSQGRFIREIPFHEEGPSISTDMQGNLYVDENYKYNHKGNFLGKVKSNIVDSKGNYYCYQYDHIKKISKIEKYNKDGKLIDELINMGVPVAIDSYDNLYVNAPIAKDIPGRSDIKDYHYETWKYDSQDNLVARMPRQDPTIAVISPRGDIYLTLPVVLRRRMPEIMKKAKGFVIIKYELIK